MPEGLVDAIMPFADFHEDIGGVDFRRSIFIFLSNTGGKAITERTFDLWKEGKNRKDMSYTDFEDLIFKGAFNEPGGLQHSGLLGKSLVDHFVPFLPLEAPHIKQCIKAAMGTETLAQWRHRQDYRTVGVLARGHRTLF